MITKLRLAALAALCALGASWCAASLVAEADWVWGAVGVLPAPLSGWFLDAMSALTRHARPGDAAAQAVQFAFLMAWMSIFAALVIGACVLLAMWRWSQLKRRIHGRRAAPTGL
ncbi:hypothetical protein [Massilia glaciei]|nr:hypothetical protein [Massilia glaciei]